MGHRDEGLAVGLINFVNSAGVRMVEASGGLGLAQKPRPLILVLEGLTREELQGYGAFELRVLGLVNDTHAAPAELGEDLVMADRVADHDGQIVPLPDMCW